MSAFFIAVLLTPSRAIHNQPSFVSFWPGMTSCGTWSSCGWVKFEAELRVDTGFLVGSSPRARATPFYCFSRRFAPFPGVPSIWNHTLFPSFRGITTCQAKAFRSPRAPRLPPPSLTGVFSPLLLFYTETSIFCLFLPFFSNCFVGESCLFFPQLYSS